MHAAPAVIAGVGIKAASITKLSGLGVALTEPTMKLRTLMVMGMVKSAVVNPIMLKKRFFGC